MRRASCSSPLCSLISRALGHPYVSIDLALGHPHASNDLAARRTAALDLGAVRSETSLMLVSSPQDCPTMRAVEMRH